MDGLSTQSYDRVGMPLKTEVSDFLPFVSFLSEGISYAIAKLEPVAVIF